MAKSPAAPRPMSDWLVYRRLLAIARPYWGHLAGTWVLTLLAAPLALVTPLPLRIVVDSVLGTHPLPAWLVVVLPQALAQSASGRLWVAVGLTVVIAVIAGLHALVSWIVQVYTIEKLTLTLRLLLFRHAQRLSLAYHDAKGSTDSVYRIQYDASSLSTVVMTSVSSVVRPAFTVLGMIAAIALMDPTLALVSLLVCPVMYITAQSFRRRLGPRWREVKRLESSAMSVIQETLGAVRVVKAFGLEEQEHERFRRVSNDRIREYRDVAAMRGQLDLVIGMTMAVGTAAVLFVGAGHVQGGALSLGALLMILTYLVQVYEPLKTMSTSLADLESGLSSARRAFAYLDEMPEAVESPHARPLERAIGGVTFRNVSFSYDKVRTVLSDVSFDIQPGARVGLQGRTGAGKSTLVSLLMRFYDPDAGQILLDGTDTRGYRLADLRDQFALVLQEPVLFSTTIWSNIACGRPGATEDEILQAARAANAHEFVTALPDGYGTQVGERGMSLSGGERQRISIARAFLKDAPILVLDEPTASVDLATERLIIDALDRLTKNRTSFLITHRPNALRHCDMVLRLENGMLVAESPDYVRAVNEGQFASRIEAADR